MECPISLETIKTPHKLNCGHTFEYDNIYKWYETKDSCPLCRNKSDDIIKVIIDFILNETKARNEIIEEEKRVGFQEKTTVYYLKIIYERWKEVNYFNFWGDYDGFELSFYKEVGLSDGTLLTKVKTSVTMVKTSVTMLSGRDVLGYSSRRHVEYEGFFNPLEVYIMIINYFSNNHVTSCDFTSSFYMFETIRHLSEGDLIWRMNDEQFIIRRI